ncbi:uncharacterized protein LOC117666806 [Pantherophis guttatus]|uniref:Uncharacterized protein LOC117666806 n=1 Tax=Pantherophis guttatus TaxID=94885 RepID=A0A6P9C7W1_PANGU|nr:uncharacterized protein LOC117666806 [Pantherophis guttatus]XP_034275678.1 uncharacterized protein LOC117666806 [Pantherophis guttatus]XP_034275686.1 uncharacterized protein LOC117666806 [Pantherophis guttatus]XP_060542599.1 uncharacterized protein LOC117666806 [Pantherophis guttatus]
MVTNIITSHRFSINHRKSHLQLTTCIAHLGALIDSEKGMVFLSPERQEDIRTLVCWVLSQQQVTFLTLSQLLGKFISCISIVPWARRHARQLQWYLLPAQKSGRSTSNSEVRLPPKVRASLEWWNSRAISKGCVFQDPSRIVVTSDANLVGWEAHLGAQVVQGLWSPVEAKNNINWLELRAVCLALRHFQDMVLHQHVLVLTDNTATKAHINREGGTHSLPLMAETDKLMSWAESHVLSLKAEHILADWLSRTQLDPSEWKLHPNLFQSIVDKFGLPVVDLFASKENAQLPRFISRFQSRGQSITMLCVVLGLRDCYMPFPLCHSSRG